jgi:hypothetical protein
MALYRAFVLICLAGFCVPGSLMAAEANSGVVSDNGAEATPVQEDSASTQSELDEESDQTDELEEEDSPSRFIPTEQISQDLGVSFPADI